MPGASVCAHRCLIDRAVSSNVRGRTKKEGGSWDPPSFTIRQLLDYQEPPVLHPPFPPLVQVRVDVPSAAVTMLNDVPLCDTPVTV